MLPKRLEETPVGLTTTALYDHHGQLLARFQCLNSERQDGIFIENMTDNAIFLSYLQKWKTDYDPTFLCRR